VLNFRLELKHRHEHRSRGKGGYNPYAGPFDLTLVKTDRKVHFIPNKVLIGKVNLSDSTMLFRLHQFACSPLLWRASTMASWPVSAARVTPESAGPTRRGLMPLRNVK